MECLILSQNACWKQKIGYKMSGTLRGEIGGLSFAATHSVYICRAKSIELLLLSLSNSKNLNFQMTQSKRHAN